MCISVLLVNLDNKEGSRSKLTNLWICHSKWNYPGMLMEERTLKKLLAASSKLSAILFFLLVMFNTKAINMVNKLSISHYVYITMLGKQNISLAFARFSMPWTAVRCMIHCLGYGLPVNLWCPGTRSRDLISFLEVCSERILLSLMFKKRIRKVLVSCQLNCIVIVASSCDIFLPVI